MMNLVSGFTGGLRARMAAATVLPVAMSSTCPDGRAVIVVLLSS